MSRKSLVIKLAGKFLLVVTIAAIGAFLIRSPVISNELAMTQMQNSNELYVVRESTNKFRPVAEFLIPCINFVIGLSAGGDIVKYINWKYKQQKENT